MRGRQVVWSNELIIELSKHFVCVAEEVQGLYPEGPRREQHRGRPDFEFFHKYGMQAPKEVWNEPGTKQGIYMMGPNSEYLAGMFATSSAEEVEALLKQAIAKWKTLAKEKGYAQKEIPYVTTGCPFPNIAESAMPIKVNMRDLPRDGARVGERYEDANRSREIWPDFHRWAWNENWIGYSKDQAKAFVPSGAAEEPVPQEMLIRLAREVLVDNVRGQAPTWQESQIKQARLTKQLVSRSGDQMTIHYKGLARMDAGNAAMNLTLAGQGVWDAKAEQFVSFSLAAKGTRSGAWPFNSRDNDRGEAPIGFSLELTRS